MLTKKQNQLLNYLIKSIESDGITPSYDELCEKLSLKSKSGIHRIVNGLEERGYIKRLENKARSLFPEKYPNGQKWVDHERTGEFWKNSNFLSLKFVVWKHV